MSCCGDSWVVPGANPNNVPGGVESVGAGTSNVTITGTPINPLINVTNVGGVTQVEGQVGNINLNGVGMTITGGSPVAGDITFTAAVQSIASANNTVLVTQPTAGNYNLAVVLPTSYTLCDYLTLTGQNNSQGSGIVIPPGGSSFFVCNPNINFFTYLQSKTKLMVSVNILYEGTATLVNNELSYGLTWGSPGILPAQPTTLSGNAIVNTTQTSGIISVALLNCSDIVNPGTNTTLYFTVNNLNTSSTTINISEIPTYFILTFI